jgi:hypothetical protein
VVFVARTIALAVIVTEEPSRLTTRHAHIEHIEHYAHIV